MISRFLKNALPMFFVTFTLTAYGAGSDNGIQTPPADAPSVTLKFGVKQLQFSWDAVSGATHYRLLENTDGASGYVQVGSDTTSTGIMHDINLAQRINASYIVQACNAGGCKDSAAVIPGAQIVESIGYFKASNAGTDDQFGFSVSLSADGSTLAVGALKEDSNATGVNSPDRDAPISNPTRESGAVYIFVRSGSAWTQQAYVKASYTGAKDHFGFSLSLSADGNTLAVGAPNEDSNATGVNPSGDTAQSNNDAYNSGAVYIFTRANSVWAQQAYVKASNTGAEDLFGASLSLSADGNTLAVGAPEEASNAIGIGNYQYSNVVPGSGAVYVFTRSGPTWTQQAYVKASNTGMGDWFGSSLSLSADGNTLAVGAVDEASNATGINPLGRTAQFNDTAKESGAVYIFTRSSSTWSQQAYVKASNTGEGDRFGVSLSLSADGNTLAVGALGEDSNATGINGDQANNEASDSGAVYIFIRFKSAWSQQAYVKVPSSEVDLFGACLSLSADGNTLAVGAPYEDSSATGINGDQSNNDAYNSGAAYIFSRAGSAWTQQVFVKASNTRADDWFGSSLSLSADGSTLAVGAWYEDGSAKGVNPSADTAQSDNEVTNSGAVHLFNRPGSTATRY